MFTQVIIWASHYVYNLELGTGLLLHEYNSGDTYTPLSLMNRGAISGRISNHSICVSSSRPASTECYNAYLDHITVFRYNIHNGGNTMNINDLMAAKSLTKYRLSKLTGIPYTTINDLCNGKVHIEKCTAETVYRLSKVLTVSMEDLIESALKGGSKMEQRSTFEIFKSNVCHRVKDMGDLDFIISTLQSDEIRRLYEKQWYPESLYLLAMVDYLSRENDLPFCSNYNDIREHSLS
jgi:DNA-binding Xre family transcriptional regulator